MDFKAFFKKRLCVAISGGVDSTALLHYLKNLENDCDFTLSAVHCEHGIRGEDSKEDMRFVQKLCADYGVVCYTFEEDCLEKSKREKVSLETAARDFRRACFASLLQEGKADFIVTAHHLQDQAETVLFRLARGSGLTGARGMQEIDGGYLRPFLSWSKEKILAYAKEYGLAHREDCTNFQMDATRNVLRLDVLPRLENAVSGASENLARFALLAAQDDAFLYELARELLVEKDGKIGVTFSNQSPLFSRACLLALRKIGLEKDYTQVHLSALFALQNSERGALLYLPNGVCAKRDFQEIYFYKMQEKPVDLPPLSQEEKFSKNGFDGGRYAVSLVKALDFQAETAWKVLRVDADKIPQNAVFRFRKDGDKIQKFGGGTQTLKKFFNDKKVPVEERAWLPLIAEKDGEKVYAVCGVEISQEIRITEETRNSFYIILQKKQGEKIWQ